ncbi:hypothetical protein Plhal304r1_c014g0050941 [Plasmopara halstedii]
MVLIVTESVRKSCFSMMLPNRRSSQASNAFLSADKRTRAQALLARDALESLCLKKQDCFHRTFRSVWTNVFEMRMWVFKQVCQKLLYLVRINGLI